MKIEKIVTKAALTAFVAFGIVTGSANATQIHADYHAMTQQEAKRAASKLRDHVDNPEKLVPPLAKTDTLEMLHAAKVGDLKQFAKDYGKAATAAIKRYVTWNLINPAHANDTDVLLTADSANLANVANNARVSTRIAAGGGPKHAGDYDVGGGWGQTPGGVGGGHAADAGMVKEDMPADLTIGAFFTAMEHRLTNVALAELSNLSVTNARDPLVGPAAIPAHFTSEAITVVKENLRDAIKEDLERWLDRVSTGGNPVFIAQVANGGGHALYQANITDAHGDAPGMFRHIAGIVSPAVPVDLTDANLTVAFNAVIDLVDAF